MKSHSWHKNETNYLKINFVSVINCELNVLTDNHEKMGKNVKCQISKKKLRLAGYLTGYPH